MKTKLITSPDFLKKTDAVILAILIWQAAADILNQKLLLVSPLTVVERLFALIFKAEFWKTVFFSLWRISTGFLCALILGIILGAIAGRFSIVETLLWPYAAVVKAVPVASFIILCLIWLSSKKLSIFISFLIVFPVIYSNILQGVKTTDTKLLEMASLYRIPVFRRILYIYLPHVKPFLISACSTALGLCWKSGIAAEVIGIPSGSIGEKLYQAKVYFDTGDLFAWTVVIVLISVIFEKLFLFILNKIFDSIAGGD